MNLLSCCTRLYALPFSEYSQFSMKCHSDLFQAYFTTKNKKKKTKKTTNAQSGLRPISVDIGGGGGGG